ncbi:snRNA-activating protein complex subunit 4 isoform X3 [Lates calcarifer]|uniref:snRNA-activating protein complex subunit 4 isoform X3 n=1 Tax=Lates calcarifer TaxID=8187 RepID=A0AAJ7Q799_LATCA|nr:snRNA-activating protein complex subunit 4 isoform X3 [Lates calcarifer]
MSVSLSEERDRIQRQVEELEKNLSVTHTELELLSSETDDDSGSDDQEDESAAGLLAQREKIQRQIQNLENVLGPHSPICISGDSESSSDESELGLSLSVDSCLQMNLVYQQVLQDTLNQLETLLTHNHRQQMELVSQLSGPIKEPPRQQPASSSYQQPINMYLGRFLKPYFKDKLTGLGPPANQETKEKASRMTGSLDDKKLKMKRWESWQKTLLIHSVSRDSLRRLIQPKLSRVDYLSQKLSSAEETDKQQLREQIDSLEREIDLLRGKKEEELIGDRYEEHDWQKISNIDFEGTREAEDIRCFWQNFLHPSINKSRWSQEEVQQLREVSQRHKERHWETIAEELGTGRTAFMCLQTFQRFVSDSLRRRTWTPAEDALLRELVHRMRIGNFIPYTQMSYFMKGRDPAQLIYRWNQVLDPSLRKGPWTKQEDQLLLQAVSRHGERSWWRIRLEVPGRSDSACRDRYHDCLKAGTKRGAFDQQERALLLTLVHKHGVGRWAKIAAEIPHRYDAQCLREWRKLSRTLPPAAQNKARKPQRSRGGEKNASTPKRKARRRTKKIKEEESSEEEQEDMVVEYMDSDEDKKKKKKEVVEEKRTEEVEQEEQEEQEEEKYIISPMTEWIPAEKAQSFSFLSFRPVELPSSGEGHSGHPVRSTILGKSGRSIIIGPNPRELRWEERHSSSAMMMVSPDQLRAHLYRKAHKSIDQSSLQTGKQNHQARVMDAGLDYELWAAVTPWIGNLLIPAKSRLTTADALREQGEKTQLTSTSVFLLLLQTMNVDTMGCKEMIEQRRNKVVLLTPPPDPSPVRPKNPKTIAGILQQRKVMKEELQELDLQHNLVLKHIQALKQQQQTQQLIFVQQPQFLPPCLPPSMPSQNHPGVLQMPPNMLLPQAVFVPHPVLQPHAASIQYISSSSPPPHRPSPVGGVTSSLHAPPALHRLIVPPVSVVPMLQNATPTSTASVCPLPAPVTQTLNVVQPLSSNQAPVNQQAVPLMFTTPTPGPSQACPFLKPLSSTLSLPRERGQKAADGQEAVCSNPSEVDIGGAGTGVEGAGDRVTEQGQRIQKPSQKASALQEATDSKAEAKKKAAPSPQRKAQTSLLLPPQQLCAPAGVSSSSSSKAEAPSPAPPPAGETTPPLLRQSDPPVFEDLPQTSTTSSHTASSTSSLPAPFHGDHDYTLVNPYSTLTRPGTTPKQPNPTHCKSYSTPNRTPRGRKRGRGEEQDQVTSGQGEQCVGGTGDSVGGAGTGVIQEGKRVRKPSQKARALQETSKAKVEAKKKRTPFSRKTRPRTSRSKEEVVVQSETPLPGLRLLPGQSMWVMTPGGLVQLAQASCQGLQLAVVPSTPIPPLPENTVSHPLAPPPQQLISGNWRLVAPRSPAVCAPLKLHGLNQPHPLAALPTCPSKPLPPTFVLQPVQNPGSCPPQPSPRLLPHKSVGREDPAEPPPLRREALQFDPSLMFLEPQEEVSEWLSGRGGVVVPGAGIALPYLPPSVSSLSMLSALLQAKKSLTRSSLQLLCRGSEPRHPQTRPETSTEKTSSQPPPDLPDSTSDLRPAGDQPGNSHLTVPSVSSDLLQEEEEAELVAAVRQLVTERFSGNPAYQLLKARFLSCFTVPALLATIQPIPEKTGARPATEDEEEEEEAAKDEDEEEELEKIKERGRQRRAERSVLTCDGSGPPANHFSGIINTNTPTPDRTGPDR